MVSIQNAKPQKLVEMTAKELQKVKGLEMPDWGKFVKTGARKERPPMNEDWWYQRTASILRRIALTGPIGVSKLRVKYSARVSRGYKPKAVYKAGGKIIRTILQKLEKAELIRYTQKGVHKGRVITPKGQSFLAKVAKSAKE